MSYREMPDGTELLEEMKVYPSQQVRRRAVPPNWGRSFPMSTAYGFDQELARVELPVPRDMTIMLGDPASTFLANYGPTCTIQYGIGGTAAITQLTQSLLGTVYHVVAQSVVVRARMEQTEVDTSLLFASNARVQAMVGIGRPSCCLANTQTVSPPVEPVLPTFFKLMPWVTRVSMTLLSDAEGTETRAIKWGTRTDFDNTTYAYDEVVPVSAFAGAGLYVPRSEINCLVFEDPAIQTYTVSITQHWEL